MADENDERYEAVLAELREVREATEQNQRDNERQDQELHVIGGLDTLRNVLEAGFGELIGQLQPLRELAPTSPASPLELEDYERFLVLRETMDRIASNTELPISEKPVGFLHDPVPTAPASSSAIGATGP
jgi:hypothetical protein